MIEIDESKIGININNIYSPILGKIAGVQIFYPMDAFGYWYDDKTGLSIMKELKINIDKMPLKEFIILIENLHQDFLKELKN